MRKSQIIILSLLTIVTLGFISCNQNQNQDLLNAWFIAGNSPQSYEIGLDNQLLQAFSVYTEDLDGDGDLDILSASSLFSASQSRVVWYENLDFVEGQPAKLGCREVETIT